MISKTPWKYAFDDNELWDLKYILAEFIVIRLQAFCQKWKDGEMWAIPVWVSPDKDLTEEEYKKIWIDILEKMIEGFQEEVDYTRTDGKYAFKSYDQNKVDEGLALFAKYFEHLWD